MHDNFFHPMFFFFKTLIILYIAPKIFLRLASFDYIYALIIVRIRIINN